MSIALYSKMPACTYLIFKIGGFSYLFHFEIILVLQKSVKITKIFQCPLYLVFPNATCYKTIDHLWNPKNNMNTAPLANLRLT